MARFRRPKWMDAYDAGGPVYGTAIANYATKTAHRKPVAVPVSRVSRLTDNGPARRVKQPENHMKST
jgi:hypothetical protein